MPLIWTDDFESYTAGAAISAPWTGDIRSLIKTSQFHGGAKSLGAGSGGFASSCNRPLGSSPSQWYADFWLYPNNAVGQGQGSVIFTPSSTNAVNALSILVPWNGAGMVRGWNAPSNLFTFSVAANAWHHFIFEVTSALAGTAKLTIDGTVAGTFSGDTRDSGGSAFISYVFITGVTIGPAIDAEAYIDDFAINSGALVAGGTQGARVMVLA